MLPDKVSIPPGLAPLLREVAEGTPVAPLPVAPAGPPAIQSSKPQAPNTCTYSLKPKAWAPSWDGRKPARGARGAHARTYTRVPGTAHGCARQIYPASQRPGWLRAQRSATAAGRRQPRLVGGPRRAARPPRAAACRSSSALPSPRGGPGNAARARDSPRCGCRPPLPGAPRAFVRRHRSPRGEGGLTSAAGAIQRRRPKVPARLEQLRRRWKRNSGRERREGRGCLGRGAVGQGWPWLGTAPAGLCTARLGRTSCLDEVVARSAGAAAPARNLNT